MWHLSLFLLLGEHRVHELVGKVGIWVAEDWKEKKESAMIVGEAEADGNGWLSG